MPKTITLLGSTGSIGTQSLDVARMHGYRIFGLAANSRVEILQKQIEEFHPKYVCMTDPDAAAKLDAALAGRANAPKLLTGPEGLKELAALDGPDVVLNSVVGIAGLGASLTAIESGHDLALANKESLLDETYVPQDLVKLTCRKISSDPIQMREVAAQALSDMFDAAKADGVTLYAHSGYRSYRTQKTMYSNRLKRNNGKDDGVVAYPGASDHQTGLGIDVINKAGIGKKFTSAFANTKEGKWIAEHCWDYGFVIRYQKEKEEITQITYEPWHLRYVGVQIAQYMRENNLCLEEFTSEWKEAAAAYQAAGN